MPAKDKQDLKSWTELREAEDVRQLRGFPEFDKFSDDQLHRLVQASHHDSTSAPWPLIHEQTPADACYILLSGEFKVYAGKNHIATLGPGEVIGESALRRDSLRSATVTSTGPSEVLRIEADDLAGLLNGIPALREIIDTTAARHAPVAAEPPASAEPKLSKVNTSVASELLSRFEQAANAAGVTVAAALEDALGQWIERNG